MNITMQIFVTDKRTGERIEITDNLYWFEENYVLSFNDPYVIDRYYFEIIINPKPLAETSD